MAESFLYVIAYDLDGPVKIGFSKDPVKRLRALQTGNPYDLSLFHTEAFDETVIQVAESAIHQDHGFRRQKGEWFDMTVAQAVAEVQFRAIHQHKPNPVQKKRRSNNKYP